MRNYIALIPIFALLGCASQPEDIATVYVSPMQYQSFSCYQIEMELQRVNRRAGELHTSLDETADNDAGQMAVGLIIFWPALFFLEGGDGPQAQEYARLKGERDALEQSAIQKSCGLTEQQLAATGTGTTMADPAPRAAQQTGAHYGAIAIRTSQRFKSGACVDQPTEQVAEACAIRECGSNCEISAVFGSGQCAAIAGTQRRTHPEDVAVGASLEAAREVAMAKCRSRPRSGRGEHGRCQILSSPSCNLGTFQVATAPVEAQGSFEVVQPQSALSAATVTPTATVESYGAIAVSQTSSFRSGVCVNEVTPQSAESCALRECGRHCEVHVSFGTGQCAAVAGRRGAQGVRSDDPQSQWRLGDYGVAQTATAAREEAMAECRSSNRNCSELVSPVCNG